MRFAVKKQAGNDQTPNLDVCVFRLRICLPIITLTLLLTSPEATGCLWCERSERCHQGRSALQQALHGYSRPNIHPGGQRSHRYINQTRGCQQVQEEGMSMAVTGEWSVQQGAKLITIETNVCGERSTLRALSPVQVTSYPKHLPL